MSATHKTLEDALAIVDKDISKISKLAEGKETLDRGEANKLTDYIKTLVLVHKEEREQAKLDNLPSKSDEDIEELAKKALEFLSLEEDQDEEDSKEGEDKPDTDKDSKPKEKEIEDVKEPTDPIPPDKPK